MIKAHSVLSFFCAVFISANTFADAPDPGGDDSTNIPLNKVQASATFVQGTAMTWINTGGSACNEQTQVVASKTMGTSIQACPAGFRGVLSQNVRDVYYLPANTGIYYNGWRNGAGAIPLCVNSDNTYSMNVCGFAFYNEGDSYYCSAIYVQYTVTCVPDSDPKYQDPSCSSVTASAACTLNTGTPGTGGAGSNSTIR